MRRWVGRIGENAWTGRGTGERLAPLYFGQLARVALGARRSGPQSAIRRSLRIGVARGAVRSGRLRLHTPHSA